MRFEFYIILILILLMIKSFIVCVYDFDDIWFLICDKYMRLKKNIICYYSDICLEGRYIY